MLSIGIILIIIDILKRTGFQHIIFTGKNEEYTELNEDDDDNSNDDDKVRSKELKEVKKFTLE